MSLSEMSGEAAGAVEAVGALDSALGEALHLISIGIGVIGVAVILWGVLRSLLALVAIEAGRGDGSGREALRNRLGYYLLLGLEFLVAADIVETISAPSLEHLTVLGAIVLIRTVISFSLNWELRQHHENQERAAKE